MLSEGEVDWDDFHEEEADVETELGELEFEEIRDQVGPTKSFLGGAAALDQMWQGGGIAMKIGDTLFDACEDMKRRLAVGVTPNRRHPTSS